MAIVKQEIAIAKEAQDVMKFIVDLVVCIKSKGDYTALLPDLINAINGINEIDDELKADLKAFVTTVELGATDLAFELLKK